MDLGMFIWSKENQIADKNNKDRVSSPAFKVYQPNYDPFLCE